MNRLALVVGLLSAGVARGDDLLPAEKPPAYPSDGLLGPAYSSAASDCPWRTDVVFGLPIALRAQRQVADTRIWVEGGVALYTFIPSVFAGMRFDGKLHDADADGLFVRPGVDFYYSPLSSSGGFFSDDFHGITAVVVDFDLVWRHRWGERFHGQIGMKLGCGAGFAGGHPFPLPVLGFTFGCQF